MNPVKISRRAVLGLISLVASLSLCQADSALVGTISRLVGSPSVRSPDGRQSAAAQGMALHAGDRITTGPGGRLEITSPDGTLIAIGEDTTVVLREFAASKDGATGRGLLDLIEGILRLQLPVPWNRFQVITGTAVASVRSTDWIVDATNENTAVFVVAGRVEVANRAMTGAVLLDPRFGTDVRAGALPTMPKRWGQARIDAALARTRLP